MQNRIFCCCLIGHRPNKLTFGYDEAHKDCTKLKVKLAVEIEGMRKKGITTFLTGMGQGVDIWGAEIILDLKHAYADEPIRLVAFIPHKEQANRWNVQYRKRYFRILEKADDVIMLSTHYAKDCMHRRNRFMVNASSHLIAVFNGEPGGTQYTIDYAQKKGLDIVIIDPNDLTRTNYPPMTIK